MKKMLKLIKNNILVMFLIAINITVLANNKILSEQVSYSNNKTNETTVNGALNELFSAVDINERLGTIDISNIGNGTVTGAINTTNNTVNTLYNNRSHIGMVIHSTTLDTMEKVKAIYGGITWVKIEGRFLLGQSSSYAVNSTGGSTSNSITPSGTISGTALTVAQLPSHTHTFTGSAVNSGNQSANHTHSIPALSGSTNNVFIQLHEAANYTGTNSGFMAVNSANTFASTAGTAGGALGTSHTHSVTTKASTTGANSANHTHSVTAAGTNSNTGSGNTHTHSFTGTAQSVSTMSPYKVVYIWERTA